MKCILDVGTNCTIKATKDNRQVSPGPVLSKWPVRWPAYKIGVKKLLKPKYRTKSMNANLKYKILMYVHAKLSSRLGAAHHSVSITLAQMCWQTREENIRAIRWRRADMLALFLNMLGLGRNETKS